MQRFEQTEDLARLLQFNWRFVEQNCVFSIAEKAEAEPAEQFAEILHEFYYFVFALIMISQFYIFIWNR